MTPTDDVITRHFAASDPEGGFLSGVADLQQIFDAGDGLIGRGQNN